MPGCVSMMIVAQLHTPPSHPSPPSIMTAQLFKQREVSFEKLGIGGLDSQFREMFRSGRWALGEEAAVSREVSMRRVLLFRLQGC